jgi:excisionase family DNA binding protein
MTTYVEFDHRLRRCRTLSVKEAAAVWGFSAQTVYNAIKAGTIKAVRISEKRVRIAESEVQRILEGGDAMSCPHQFLYMAMD